MKIIILWLLAIFLGVAPIGMAPMANPGGAELWYRYMSDGGLIVSQSSSSGEDLVVNDENPWGGATPGSSKVFEVEVPYEVWPGDSGNVTLKLQNVGGNGTLELQFLNLVDEPGITPEPEPTPDSGELSQKLDMLIWWDDSNDGIYDAGEGPSIVEDTLYNIAGVTYNLGALNNSETKYLGIAWSVDSTVGNEIMGDKCTFDIRFALH